MKRVTVAVALMLWTWLWLLPIAGFHHMMRCGLLGWAILDGEDGPIEVRWSGWTLIISLAIWLAGVAPVATMRRRGRHPVSAK
jgi:hypothetical protein